MLRLCNALACVWMLLTAGCREPTNRVVGPNGAELTLPAGALTSAIQVTLALPPVGSRPPLPPGMAPVGATYSLAPVGLTFAIPAQVAIPFDPAQIPSGARPLLLSTGGEFNASWRSVEGARPAGNRMHGMTDGAGTFVVVVRLELPSLTTTSGESP